MQTRVAISLTLIILACITARAAFGERIGQPAIAISGEEFVNVLGSAYQPDGQMSILQGASGQAWIMPMWDKVHGGIVHLKAIGSLDRPLSSVKWIRTQSELFTSTKGRAEGNLWLLNTYYFPEGILAFAHLENFQGTGRPGSTGKSRIGLAWSADEGETFTYLGHIIIPFGDPDPHNIQGVPYIVKGGFFYIYFHDTQGLTVARALVSEVLAAATQGRTSSWMKYNGREKGFTSVGLGGKAATIGIDGISHTDAGCSVLMERCYLLLTRMNWRGEDTWVKLYESSDGVRWALRSTITQQPAFAVGHGYQYATIINEDGHDNARVSSRFYIYVYKDHQDDSRILLRWSVDLSS
jgi:hypothetical protein